MSVMPSLVQHKPVVDASAGTDQLNLTITLSQLLVGTRAYSVTAGSR